MAELPEAPLVSVILCTYSPDMYEHFREAAESVLDQTYNNLELMVVVDGSGKVGNHIQMDFGDREEVVIHVNQRNRGLLESRNTGAKHASGDIIAFMDDDAVADDRWIEEIVDTYQATYAISVGGKMVPLWVDGKPAYLPEEFYFLVGVTHKGFADGPGEVRNTFGSNLTFRRDVFLQLNGFDPTMGGRHGDRNLQGGETELCARMYRTFGEGVRYTPEAIVSHKVFKYRTRPLWLLSRAFWQGYSKRGMQVVASNATLEEREFLRRLVIDFLPARLLKLFRRPSMERIVALGFLILLTAAVGAGYGYGYVRFGLYHQ